MIPLAFGWMDLSNMPFTAVALLEEAQFSWLPQLSLRRELALCLRANPDVEWIARHKCPAISVWLDALTGEFADEPDPDPDELRRLERAVLEGMEDWIIYVTEPEAYDRQRFNRWDDRELTELIDFTGKTVLDIGAGTGSQTFRLAPLAKSVFAVEPVGNLRRFIRSRAKELRYFNVYAVDGLIEAIPFPDGFADAVTAGHVFGDRLEAEYAELTRVTKPGGMMVLIPGNNDQDNTTHEFLMRKGFEWSRFEEPGSGIGSGWKRKYWKVK